MEVALDPRDDALVACVRGRRSPHEPARSLESSRLLAALRHAGTSHVYADTADVAELAQAVATPAGRILAEVDGNTVNQPLVGKVVDRYRDADGLAACASAIGRGAGDAAALRYAVVCGWIGQDVVRAFASGRRWEVSLQLHMGLGRDAEASKRVGRLLRRMVPAAFVKVPFTPHLPQCLLIARDLEREGIPVNFTSTFSARQVVVAALLANVTRTNVFMGRLNQGLEAQLLGEHVALESQRQLRRLRADDAVQTLLIVASIRDWQTFVHVAGCDVFTAPCEALRAFLHQTEYGPGNLPSRLEESYEGRLGIGERARTALGLERIGRLWRVEPELVEFLRVLRASDEWTTMRDGDRLARRFDEAGFGDVFHHPDPAAWAALHERKLPDLDAPVTRTVALDTLYSLLADADFENHQRAIDEKLVRAGGR